MGLYFKLLFTLLSIAAISQIVFGNDSEGLNSRASARQRRMVRGGYDSSDDDSGANSFRRNRERIAQRFQPRLPNNNPPFRRGSRGSSEESSESPYADLDFARSGGGSGMGDPFGSGSRGSSGESSESPYARLDFGRSGKGARQEDIYAVVDPLKKQRDRMRQQFPTDDSSSSQGSQEPIYANPRVSDDFSAESDSGWISKEEALKMAADRRERERQEAMRGPRPNIPQPRKKKWYKFG